MPSVSRELTLGLKTILEGNDKTPNPGTALRDPVSSPGTTLCTNTDRGFAFPAGNESGDKKPAGEAGAGIAR